MGVGIIEKIKSSVLRLSEIKLSDGDGGTNVVTSTDDGEISTRDIKTEVDLREILAELKMIRLLLTEAFDLEGIEMEV